MINSVIAVLIIIQLVSAAYLWSLNTVGLIAERLFALFLGADVLAFAMVSYIYRSYKREEPPRSSWLVVGAIMLVILMFSSLLL